MKITWGTKNHERPLRLLKPGAIFRRTSIDDSLAAHVANRMAYMLLDLSGGCDTGHGILTDIWEKGRTTPEIRVALDLQEGRLHTFLANTMVEELDVEMSIMAKTLRRNHEDRALPV